MTKLEKQAIKALLERRRNPSVTAAEYDPQLGRVEHHTPAESEQLLDSEDFRKGWEACYQNFVETLTWIPVAKPAELKRFAR